MHLQLVTTEFTPISPAQPALERPKRKKRKKIAGMQYYVRSNQFRASNVYYDVDAEQAYSYDWWCFVKRIGGVLVFNQYYYSASTRRHQSKVALLLEELGLEYVTIETSETLAYDHALEDAITDLRRGIRLLETAISKPRSHKTTNERRRNEIQTKKNKINMIQILIDKRDKEYQA